MKEKLHMLECGFLAIFNNWTQECSDRVNYETLEGTWPFQKKRLWLRDATDCIYAPLAKGSKTAPYVTESNDKKYTLFVPFGYLSTFFPRACEASYDAMLLPTSTIRAIDPDTLSFIDGDLTFMSDGVLMRTPFDEKFRIVTTRRTCANIFRSAESGQTVLMLPIKDTFAGLKRCVCV